MYQREKSCDPSLHGTLTGPTNRYVHVKITIHGGDQMKPYSEVESLFSNFHRYWFGRLFFSRETWWNMIKHDEPYPKNKSIAKPSHPTSYTSYTFHTSCHILHILHIPYIPYILDTLPNFDTCCGCAWCASSTAKPNLEFSKSNATTCLISQS